MCGKLNSARCVMQKRDSMCKAAVWRGENRLEVVERAIPSPGPGEVLLRVRVAGICGTDLHILTGRHPEARPPLVPGHEFAGEVSDVGKGVASNLIGTRFGSDSYVGCRECRYCRSRRPQLCEKGTCELGINRDGGWSEYVVVPAENLYPLPDKVSFLEAGAGCILNCPMAAIEAVGVTPGDVVLIIGDGPSSLVMIQLAALKGASKVIVAGHRKRRLSLALELGASQVVNTHAEDLTRAIKSLGSAPQVVIDAVGKSETFDLALSLAGREGRIHLFGLPEGPMDGLRLDALLFKELRIVSSTGAPTLWPKAMDLLCRGQLRIAPLISHRFPIEEAPAALDYIRSHPDEMIKAVFEMNGASA
jgi:2-desacetyl-2-hydroxyethyl bacteriochlorophyllide A dehydrogenase